MNLAVTGAAGLLGQKLGERAAAAGHDVSRFDLVAVPQAGAGFLRHLDISNRDEVKRVIEDLAPEWVLNTAAYTAVDASEANEERVRSVNVDGVSNLLAAARGTGTRVLTLSTDYVFDGREGPYAEDVPRNPLGIYGASKAEMEDVVSENGGPHLVVRTMVLYGSSWCEDQFRSMGSSETAGGGGGQGRNRPDRESNPCLRPGSGAHRDGGTERFRSL